MLRIGDLFWLGIMVIFAPFWIPVVIIGKIAELLGFSLDRGDGLGQQRRRQR